MIHFNDLDMLVSGIINKGGKKKACVYFQDKNDKNVYAEGFIPDCKITSSSGFGEEEITALEEYLKENVEEIKKTSAGVNPIRAMMKDE